jgi:hypothetical protein
MTTETIFDHPRVRVQAIRQNSRSVEYYAVDYFGEEERTEEFSTREKAMQAAMAAAK